ncbi:hypothetical protein MX572_23445 (plasmid) [Rhodococcus pyridinivorans]|uniref:Mu transposase domain-containing protein n=1 Tax=Rhodococcus pyridinivorans TaxID=103816 RepID=UPI0020C63D77|nr:hypothetical protein [Rhodococcus pyridinivorans]UTM39806.1 hypothetical protein MX572_23445 [Rhodococcus pyridinivorans]
MIWDNEPGIGRGRRHADGVTGTLATKLVVLRPHDPESKGLVERRDRWLETSFIPGRTFASPADFNSQLADWLTRANTRLVRTTKAAPIELLDANRAAMVPLHRGWRNRIRLGRDYYARIDTCDYSVDPTAIGRIVDVTGDLEQDRFRSRNARLGADESGLQCSSQPNVVSCSFGGPRSTQTLEHHRHALPATDAHSLDTEGLVLLTQVV